MATVTEQLRALQLSASEISEFTGWPSYMIEDYLNLISAIITLADNADSSAVDNDNIEQLINDALINIERGIILARKAQETADLAPVLDHIRTNKTRSSITSLEKRLDNLEQLILE